MKKIIGTGIYSRKMAFALARKIEELNKAKVEFDIRWTVGINNETVVRVDWDQSALDRYYEKDSSD